MLRVLAIHVLKGYGYETVGKPVQNGALHWLAKNHPGLFETEMVKQYSKAFDRMISYRLHQVNCPASISSVIA